MDLKLFNDKKVYLYPVGKYQKDFEYIFDELKIEGYLSTDLEKYNGKLSSPPPVINITDVKNMDNEEIKVIICSEDKALKKSLIDNWGYEYESSIIYAEELFELLDEDQNIDYWAKGRKVACIYDKSTTVLSGGVNVPWFCDTILILQDNVQENEISMIRNATKLNVCLFNKIDDLKKENYYYVIYMNEFEKGICYLEEKGLVVRKDFMDGKVFSHVKNSDMLRETIRATSHQHHDCRLPFYNCIISADLLIFPCCPSGVLPEWRDYHRLYFFSSKEMWESNWFKIFRLSMINKTYCFCDHHFCNRLVKNAGITDTRLDNVVTLSKPTDMQLEIDYTCNLHCPSCRDGIKVATSYRRRILDKIVPEIKKTGMMDDLVWTRLAGYGDVFASKYYQELLYTDKKRKNLFLITNGVLFTEEKFNPLPEMYEKIRIYISIDAAKPETYAKMRPGGNWEKLNKNLEMLSQKKKLGLIDRFIIQFVVQMDNYKEIPNFVALGKRLGVTYVYFNNIRNWGFPDEVFQKKNILNDDYSVKEEVLPYIHSKEVEEAPEGFVIFDFVK